MSSPGAAVSEQEIRWKCRRGMLELDLLLRGFIDERFDELSEEDVQTLVLLLDYPDQVLQDLLVNGSPSSDSSIASVVQLIRENRRDSLSSSNS